MLKNVLIGLAVLVIVVGLGAFFWARSVLTQDNVRATLAAQLSEATGQPVTIGGIGATIYPRVTVNLDDVVIGDPPRIQVRTLHVGTAFGALLSRRIEHATLRLSGARIELPLPPLDRSSEAGTTVTESDEPMEPPVEIVSIDEIVLNEVEIASGGRTLRGDVEIVPEGSGVTLRRVSLAADDAAIEITGQITDLTGPVGELTVTSTALSFDQLLAFFEGFTGGAGLRAPETREAASVNGPAGGSPEEAPSGAGANLTVALEADSATMGRLNIQMLTGRARVTAREMTLDPIGFDVFGGRYEGALTFALGSETPEFRGTASLSDIDMAAATSLGGGAETITGRLSGQLDLSGRGTDVDAVMQSARGTASVAITDGVVRNLGLLRAVVIATSMRAESIPALASGTRDEPFTRLGGTLAIGGGVIGTENLRFEGTDVSLTASGTIQLDGSAIDLAGRLQLSEALTRQAGRDLVRYTQEQGRVTLPATITGSADDPSVRVDVADAAQRALRNRATEEAGEAIKRGLGRLFR